MAKTYLQSIHIAIEFGDEAIIKTLLALCTEDVNIKDPSTGRTLVHTAVDRDNVEALKMLLLRGADVNVFSNDNLAPLHLAVRNKSTRIVEILLDHGADPNPAFNCDKTPLYMAIERDCPMIVAMLLERGASIRHSTIRNVTVFDVARKTGNMHLCLLLLRHADKQLRLVGS